MKTIQEAIERRESKMYRYYKSVFVDGFEGGYPVEYDDELLKIRREAIAEERKRIEKGIKEVYQNAKEDHICRFNDGDCDCECYYTAINDVIRHLTQE